MHKMTLHYVLYYVICASNHRNADTVSEKTKGIDNFVGWVAKGGSESYNEDDPHVV